MSEIPIIFGSALALWVVITLVDWVAPGADQPKTDNVRIGKAAMTLTLLMTSAVW
jgi:hypothetical protein